MTDSIEQERRAGQVMSDLLMAGSEFRSALSHRIGLGVTESMALTYLDANGGRPQHELAAWLNLTAGAVTGVVDRLTAQGFATRVPHPSDRRSSLISLTDAGHAKVVEQAGWLARLVEYPDGSTWGDEQVSVVAELVAGMNRVAQALRASA